MKEEVKVEKKKSKDSDVIASISRRLEKVIKWLEVVHGCDIDGDKKVGSIGVKLLSVLAVFAFAVTVLAVEIVDNKSAGTGTYTLTQASNGTGDITLTVDAVAADVTGDVVTAPIVGLSATEYFTIQNTTQLVFIVTGVATNVIDADITTP